MDSLPKIVSKAMVRIFLTTILGITLMAGGCASVSEQQLLAQELGVPASFTNSLGMQLVLIPAGEFLMGSPDSATEADRNEKPQHRVRITKPFYMSTCEVTQKQYQQLMDSNSSIFKGNDLPVEMVSQGEANTFCKQLSEKDGRVYRLPTEAQWEYACRAGTTTRYAFGNKLTPYTANYNSSGQGKYRGKTTPVGSFPPNRWGLYDMHGNVWEWCSDRYSETYYANSPVDDPQGASTGKLGGTVRGGSWYYGPWHSRSTARDRYASVDRFNYHFGFRVICEIRTEIGR